MKLLLTSALMIVSAASAATVEKPYELSPEEITFLANTPCDGRGSRKWCTNGWGDFTCEWNRGQCKEVKSSSDCEDNGWRDCQSDSSCKWKSSNGRGRGRCVRNEVDCDDLDWKGCQGESECKWKSSNGRGRGRCVDNKKETSSTWETREPKSDAPGIRYFTFQGFGICQPSDGYEKQFVSKPGTPQNCAKHCENNDNQYGKSLAGIEYYKAKPSWGRPDDTCNCLMDVNYETGGITSVEEDSMGETYCYSNDSYMEELVYKTEE